MDQINKERCDILYVDDEQSSLNAFENLYRRKFNIITASSGKKGLEILEAQPVQVVIADQRMPEMTGVDFLLKVKNKWPDLKYILLTAFDEYEVIKEAINEAGIYWYLNKPFEPDQLEQIITNASNAYHAENKLKESEEKFRGVFESITDVFTRSDMNGKCVLISPSIYKMIGYKPEEIIGKNLADFYADPKQRTEIVNELKSTKGTINFEFDIVRKDGKLITVSSNTKMYYNSKGEPLGVEGVFRDISEKKKLEEERYQSEQRYQALSEASFEAIFISEKGVCIEQNSQAEKMFGYTLSEAVGRKGTEWIVPEDREMVMNKMLSGYDTIPYETTALRKDGSTFPAEIQAKMMHFKGRDVRITALNDITERKKAEDALSESEERLRSITENSSDIITLVGPDLKIQFINKTDPDLKKEDIIGKSINDYTPKDLQKFVTEKYQNLFKTGKPTNYETKFITAAGETHYYDVRLSPITKEGKVISIVSNSNNVTKRKKVDEQNRKFNKIIETTSQSVIITNIKGTVLYVNPSYYAFSGFVKDEVIGKSMYRFAHKKGAIKLAKEVVPALIKKRHWQGEMTVVKKDKQIVPVDLVCSLLSDEKNKPEFFVALFSNITERKRTEEALQESEEKFRTLVTKTEEIIFIIANDGTFLLSEGKGLDKLGLKPGEVVGKSIFDLYKDFPAMLDKMRLAFNGETVIMEHEVGDIYFKSWYTPHFNQKGDIIGLLGLAVNITERKLAETQNLKYQRRLKDLAQELTLSEEKIRKQIAVDLHDHVGQMLSSSRMQLAKVIEMEENPELESRIKNISQALLKAIQSTRAAIFDLSPPQLIEIGLYAAVHDWMKEQIERKHGINTIITGEQEIYPLEENTRILIFRSIKELMMNSVKHARASRLVVDFRTKNEMLEVTVQDDGVGFNYNPDLFKLKGDVYGLFSIQERIADLGGMMIIDSVIDQGTKAKLLVPLQNNLP